MLKQFSEQEEESKQTFFVPGHSDPKQQFLHLTENMKESFPPFKVLDGQIEGFNPEKFYLGLPFYQPCASSTTNVHGGSGFRELLLQALLPESPDETPLQDVWNSLSDQQKKELVAEWKVMDTSQLKRKEKAAWEEAGAEVEEDGFGTKKALVHMLSHKLEHKVGMIDLLHGEALKWEEGACRSCFCVCMLFVLFGGRHTGVHQCELRAVVAGILQRFQCLPNVNVRAIGQKEGPIFQPMHKMQESFQSKLRLCFGGCFDKLKHNTIHGVCGGLEETVLMSSEVPDLVTLGMFLLCLESKEGGFHKEGVSASFSVLSVEVEDEDEGAKWGMMEMCNGSLIGLLDGEDSTVHHHLLGHVDGRRCMCVFPAEALKKFESFAKNFPRGPKLLLKDLEAEPVQRVVFARDVSKQMLQHNEEDRDNEEDEDLVMVKQMFKVPKKVDGAVCEFHEVEVLVKIGFSKEEIACDERRGPEPTHFQEPSQAILDTLEVFAFGKIVASKDENKGPLKLKSSFGNWHGRCVGVGKPRTIHRLTMETCMRLFGASAVRRQLFNVISDAECFGLFSQAVGPGKMNPVMTPKKTAALGRLGVVGEEVEFNQRNCPTCLTLSLASALVARGRAFGEPELVAGAAQIHKAGVDKVWSDTSRMDWQEFVKVAQQQARGMSLHSLNLRSPDVKVSCPTECVSFLIEGCRLGHVHSVTLLTKKETCDHAVAVWKEQIHDSTWATPLRLCLESLELCCNDEGLSKVSTGCLSCMSFPRQAERS